MPDYFEEARFDLALREVGRLWGAQGTVTGDDLMMVAAMWAETPDEATRMVGWLKFQLSDL